MRYGFVGIANTALTLVVVFVLLRLNTHPAIANVAGYAVGLTNSYLMNRSFTFGARRHPLLPFFDLLCDLVFHQFCCGDGSCNNSRLPVDASSPHRNGHLQHKFFSAYEAVGLLRK
ncbi:GtrA family protein [Oricola sp.]|uniref:GtrA family protein n=1 Tax=Oricola sp. TaxID=1979950 RepID=UPI0035599D28